LVSDDEDEDYSDTGKCLMPLVCLHHDHTLPAMRQLNFFVAIRYRKARRLSLSDPSPTLPIIVAP
jgi:hypothetical protein